MNIKHYAGALGFAFIAAWIAFGFGDAILCLPGAAIFSTAAAWWQGEPNLSELQDRLGRATPRSTTRRSGSL